MCEEGFPSERPRIQARSVHWASDANALQLIAEKGSWRQYPAYSREAAALVGASSRYLVITRDGKPIAVANLRTRRYPLLGAVALISNGPVLLRQPDHWMDDLGLFARVIVRVAENEELSEVLIDPPVSWALMGIDPGVCLPRFLPDATCAPYRSIVLDLEDSEDRIRSRFHPKWRRDLARGEGEGFVVTRSERPEDIALLEPLLQALSQRKSFSINHDVQFFGAAAAQAERGERIAVHLVRRGDTIVSGHIGAYSGDTATYLLGASTSEGLTDRAAYVAQWAAIQFAREVGSRWYDTGGVDPDRNPDVYRFKKRMGGQDVEASRRLVLTLAGLKGTALRSARRTYQWFKR